MRSLERVNIRTNERTYVLTYIRTGQTLYPLDNFVVGGDNKTRKNCIFQDLKLIDMCGIFIVCNDISYIIYFFKIVLDNRIEFP